MTAPEMFYVDASVPAGSTLPMPTEYSERAAYVVLGSVACGGDTYPAGEMLVFNNDTRPLLRAIDDARLMVLGGEPVGDRHIWWNFVSSSKERLEQAKAEWKQGPGATENFPLVPGDSDEFIPLPE